MNSFQTFLFEARYRHEIYLQEAEHAHLVRLALNNKPCADSWLTRYLLWIDRLMERSGVQSILRSRAARLSQRNLANEPVRPVRPVANCG
jgi:hypothetical protein